MKNIKLNCSKLNAEGGEKMGECVYVADTPLGCCCTIANKECIAHYVKECNEPEWRYLMKMSEDYVEEEE